MGSNPPESAFTDASMYVVADAVKNVKYGFLVFEISLLIVILFGILMHFVSPWCLTQVGYAYLVVNLNVSV